MSVVKCGGVFHLRRGVRVSFKSVDGRTSVCVSLKADSEMMTSAKALTVWNWLVKACEDTMAGQSFEAVKRSSRPRSWQWPAVLNTWVALRSQN
jgi:hypothetical protein